MWQRGENRGRGLWTLGALPLLLASLGACASETSEFDRAMTLMPDLANGVAVYGRCVSCHGAEGWGDAAGIHPQIAGQPAGVLIKQLANFRVGNRDHPIMRAFSSRQALGGAQDIADVAAYIEQLPMTADNGRALGGDLELGKRIYREECASCHGVVGEGNAVQQVPALAGQHYEYLVRQFSWIRNGRRRNTNPAMVEQIKRFSSREISAVMAYTASLEPARAKLAPPGWTNPDFPRHWRGLRPATDARHP